MYEQDAHHLVVAVQHLGSNQVLEQQNGKESQKHSNNDRNLAGSSILYHVMILCR